jgi:hypothetical protein
VRIYRIVQLAYENALGMTPAGRLSIKATKAALDLAAAMAGAERAEAVEPESAEEEHKHRDEDSVPTRHVLEAIERGE